MAHVRHSMLRPLRGLGLPALKGSQPTHFFDYDRFFHSPWTHSLPVANLKQLDKSFEIELIIPGFNKSDFSVVFENGLLKVSAEVKYKKGGNKALGELASSSFSRSFNTPPNTTEEDIQARYEDGVLTLAIARKKIRPNADTANETQMIDSYMFVTGGRPPIMQRKTMPVA